MSDKFVIGIDFGTDSVRSLIVNALTGEEVSTFVYYYPRWSEGRFCNPSINQFRQHPLDYLESMEIVVKKSLEKVSLPVKENIVAISVDTTGSTPVAVNAEGIPLSLLPEFKDDPDAMFILWKDHTAIKEADEINTSARSWGGIDYTKYEGGVYSAEWFWAKMLNVLRKNKKVRDAAYSWVEHCDWISAVLTGNTNPLSLKRSRCTAGHKAMWHKSWGGLPSGEFLESLDPLLSGIRERLYSETYTCDFGVGFLSDEWQKKFGLPGSVAIGAGSLDAHMGAIGGGIKPYYISKVMGTSTCDMMVIKMVEGEEKLIKGICGQVDGSIIPGMLGLEAGQSAFGDIYAWFRDVLFRPSRKIITNAAYLDQQLKDRILKELYGSILPVLTDEAERIPPSLSAPLAMDWMNGRRNPDADPNLKGAITGLTLGSTAPVIFRSLVEASAFGGKMIAERFKEEGVRVDGIMALGGVAKKSPFVVQIVSDVLDMPIMIVRSEQACALGAAMAASVVGGIYPDIEKAQQKMGSGFETEYKPNPERVEIYKTLFKKYKILGSLIEEYNIP